ncbi:MAG: Coenzyme F420 hydrogenase/dehydrogenase, beta subunit C-terminal domain, partial [Planctomycetota bacterium]
MNNVVRDVVQEDRCCSCGVCAGLCPTNALSMKLQINGDLTPHVSDGRCLDKCHICLDVCPFSQGVYNPRERNTQLFSVQSDAKCNEDIGWHMNSIVGFRCDETLRKASASGGLATWCLETLLSAGVVTRIAVVRFAENHDKGFFEFYSASTIDELRKSSGSIYHPIEISDITKEIVSNRQERWAVVGVPCLCSAIRNIGHLQNRIPFVFGLVCGMYQNTFYTEMLLSKSGVDRECIIGIEYRRKSDGESPSNFRFRGTDNRQHGTEIAYHGLPYFLGKNAYFRQNACNYCMDVFAETADACFMDAWLPAYSHESKGTSLVVVRNRALSDLFEQGQAKGEVSIDGIGPEEVLASQRGHVRRKRELIYMRRGIHTQTVSGKERP